MLNSKNEKLQEVYLQTIAELNLIGFDFSKEKVGDIEIKISARNNKRYGCCKQLEPDNAYKIIEKRGRAKYIKYEKYNKHQIEISRWVLDLDDTIIKNTIAHELIHCLPYCNNHGLMFKKYANYINSKLGYNISRLGNKKSDYEYSNIEYKTNDFKYTIKCTNCGKQFGRNRLQRDFFKKYRCLCNGKLMLIEKKN